MQYAQDTARAWADYHVTETGIGRDLQIAWTQLNVSQVNAADPLTFAWIEPYYGSTWGLMMGGFSAIQWAYPAASGFIQWLDMPAAANPEPPAASSSGGSPGSDGSQPTGFWDSLAHSGWSMGQTCVGIWQWGCSWFDGNADYITTFQNAYDYGPLGQTQNSSGFYYWGSAVRSAYPQRPPP